MLPIRQVAGHLFDCCHSAVEWSHPSVEQLQDQRLGTLLEIHSQVAMVFQAPLLPLQTFDIAINCGHSKTWVWFIFDRGLSLDGNLIGW